ncbi:ABC transporter ATP-binding protein [Fodinisporobacter ferrooxydans]|uniref:ABC transporter ATP-binding protein n=1 Tax=Fodinisporobacter ferrooxydans TaxID=2901836 RepID=A0ABY4CUA6_9BACL|nr:ABC transporter ATP-binding protein [Alicyclobacillaceae bacterium MYW30-H2]
MSTQEKPNAPNTVLEVKNLHKHFGGVKAVNGIDFVVKEGDVAVLIGPNGSGKTTAINLLSGIYTPTDGEIVFAGGNIAGLKPSDITKKGIARTFQNIRLFPELTVLENVMIGSHTKGSVGIIGTLVGRRKGLMEDRTAANKALEALRFVGIERHQEQAKNLPYGQQRLVEIARALVSEPKLLLLDEPAAGMNAEETVKLVKLIKKLNQMGLTILLIEHDMSLVAEVATRAYVMDFGRKISEGDIQKVLNDPIVIQAYLGEEIEYDYA